MPSGCSRASSPAPEHGWLAFHEGYIAHASGDTARAGELARTATELGRRLGVPDLEMLGLALEGATLVACARVDEGMRRLDEATATALEGGAANPMSGAWTFCFLVSACTAVLDYGRAAQWCDRIAEFAERYGSRMMLGYCRAEYGDIYLWRGRWGDAEAMLEAAIDGLHAVAAGDGRRSARRSGRAAPPPGPVQRGGAAVRAAEGSSSGQLCLARMALDRGDAQEAAELVERLLRNVPEHRRLSRAPALELLVRARAAERRPRRRRRRAGRACARSSARSGPTPLRACADIAEGVLAAARGEHDRARVLLEDAVDTFTRSGAPFEAAQARLALADSLAALGRGEAAARESAAARERLRELGAPAALPLPELTPREREVLALLAEGLTNRGIAERLVLSEHTVHRHVTSILRKLDLPSRTAAAALAVRAGLS